MIWVKHPQTPRRRPLLNKKPNQYQTGTVLLARPGTCGLETEAQATVRACAERERVREEVPHEITSVSQELPLALFGFLRCWDRWQDTRLILPQLELPGSNAGALVEMAVG
jgi:hypothetical protein